MPPDPSARPKTGAAGTAGAAGAAGTAGAAGAAGAAGRRQLLRRAVAWPLLPLASAAWLSACASSPWPDIAAGAGSSSARARLQESADAHGLAAWRGLRDINVSYRGGWRALAQQRQPVLVDAGYRAGSQERLLPGAGLLAQDHRGDAGHKQVLRRQAGRGGPGGPGGPGPANGDVTVWLNGSVSTDRDVRDAAALVADGYSLFLAGPMALAGFAGPVNWGPPETLHGRRCDQLLLDLVPGLGFAAGDRLALFIDREPGLLRRLRVSLNGLRSTVGAVAEVDFFDHLGQHGVQWPRRFAERLGLPVPDLPVHDWRLTGLDVNRGYGPDALSGAQFGGAAAAPARPLPPG